MKTTLTSKMFLMLSNHLVKKDIKDKEILRRIKKEYKTILQRAKDIGDKNNLIASYYLAMYFIALNRVNKVSPDQNYKYLEDGILRSKKIICSMLGNSKTYFSDKKMEFRKKWAKETEKKKYENDWVVEFVPKYDKYEFGLNYHECGVVKLCKDEGCFELAKYLCKLDFLLVVIIGIKLDRTKTLSNNDDYCDFRFYK